MRKSRLYDPGEMTKTIEAALAKERDGLVDTFHGAFETVYGDGMLSQSFSPFGRYNPEVSFRRIVRYSDLDDIHGSQGFYVIFSTAPVDGSRRDSRLKVGSAPAIYRGHSYTVKRRIESHLFRSKHASHKIYTQCLKLRPGDPNGVDIDKLDPSLEWYVAVHHLPQSSVEVRKCAEIAFDKAFGRPRACREREAGEGDDDLEPGEETAQLS